MLRPEYQEIDTFRAEYAQPFDFCQALEKNMKSLYLLAFLLTANREVALQCFTETIDATMKAGHVFKASLTGWIKRSLVKSAIRASFTKPIAPSTSRSHGSEEQNDPRLNEVIATVTGLDRAERFVFVMSVLEGYSARDCSLLLNCSTEQVNQLKVRSLRRLASSLPLLMSSLDDSSSYLEASA